MLEAWPVEKRGTDADRQRDGIRSVVQLYEAWGKSAQAGAWRARLGP